MVTIYDSIKDRVRRSPQRRFVLVICSVCYVFILHQSFISNPKQECFSRGKEQENYAPKQEYVSRGEEQEYDAHHQEKAEAAVILPHRSNPDKIYKEDVTLNLGSEWTPERAEERRRLFKQRATEVKQRCETIQKSPGYFSPKTNRLMNNMRWVQKHNLVWCPIFKSASTTWVKNLLLLAGETVLNKPLHGRVRELYPTPEDPKERQRLLESSMKLIIVRHPLDRLLSAYRDKMLRVGSACDPYIRVQKDIIEKYEDPNGDELPTSVFSMRAYPNKTKCLADILGVKPRALAITRDSSGKKIINHTFVHPTFNQFLLKVMDELSDFWDNKGHSPLNPHWQPYWITCGPCTMDYDLIAHVETLGPDQEYIIRELGLQDILFNAHTHASNFDRYNGTSEAANHYFKGVSRKLLQEVIKFYKPDFEIFGYSTQEYLSLTQED